MNFLSFEYFKVLCEHRNFTKAAKSLYISQQSLSSHIASLEKELGVALFDRTTPLKLTHAGRVFEEYVTGFLAERDEMLKKIGDIRDSRTGEIRIGISHTRGKIFLPHILPLFTSKYPSVRLTVLEGNNQELSDAMRSGQIDLMIDRLPFRIEDVETEELGLEHILLILPDAILEKHFGARKGKVLERIAATGSLKDLKDCPFLLNKEGNTVRSISDRLFSEDGFRPEIAFETENIETLLALARQNLGITFYPQMFIPGELNGVSGESEENLHVLLLRREGAQFTLGIGVDKKRYIPQATRAFIEMAKEEMKET